MCDRTLTLTRTLNTQSRAQQTHSRSRSLRAHPHSADPPSVMPRAARLGRRSWVGRHRQAERLGHLLRGRVLHRHREALRRERHERPRRPRRLVVLRRAQLVGAPLRPLAQLLQQRGPEPTEPGSHRPPQSRPPVPVSTSRAPLLGSSPPTPPPPRPPPPCLAPPPHLALLRSARLAPHRQVAAVVSTAGHQALAGVTALCFRFEEAKRDRARPAASDQMGLWQAEIRKLAFVA